MNIKYLIIISVLAVLSITSIGITISYKHNIQVLESKVSDLESENQKLQNKVKLVDNEKTELIEKFSEELSEVQSNASISRIGSASLSRGLAIVVYKPSSCDYFILENSSGYIVAEWMGSNDPDLGDRLTGDFNSFGTKDFYNQTKDSESHLWIDNYMLSKEDALEEIQDKCN